MLKTFNITLSYDLECSDFSDCLDVIFNLIGKEAYEERSLSVDSGVLCENIAIDDQEALAIKLTYPSIGLMSV